MNKKPLVSIVILNYNQTKVTCEFLESTRLLTYENYETIVVDNASKQNPVEEINNGSYPNVKLIISDKNLGFTGGNNLGISKAKGDYIFIVNNDTEVTPNLLELLLEPFLRDGKVGVTCPKICFFERPDIIQYAGFFPMNHFTGRTFAVGSREEDKGQHDFERETYGAHGAAMMVKREVIDKVGAFENDFFIYYEEWDWSTRIRKADYKIIYQGQAVVFHKESITMGKESAVKAYFHTRNRLLYMRRNTTSIQLFAFTLFLIFFIIPKSVVKYTVNKQVSHLKAFIRGLLWHVNRQKFSLKI